MLLSQKIKHNYLILFFSFLIVSKDLMGQVAINDDGSAASVSAMLDISSNDQGVLMPNMSTGQREAINSPALGLLVYDTTTSSFWIYTNDGWHQLQENRADEIYDVDNDSGIKVNNINNASSIVFKLDGEEKVSIDTETATGTVLGILDEGFNTFIGKNCGLHNTGIHNTMYGMFTGENLQTGDYNTFIGNKAGQNLNSGSNNILIGNQAGESLSSGSNNIMIGRTAGTLRTSGNNNIYIGYAAGAGTTSHSGNVFIGHRAGIGETENNKLIIAANNDFQPLVYGDFMARQLHINGTIHCQKLILGDRWISYDGSSDKGIRINNINKIGFNAFPTKELVVGGTAKIKGNYRLGYAGNYYAAKYDRPTLIACAKINADGNKDSSFSNSSFILATNRISTGKYHVEIDSSYIKDQPIVTAVAFRNDVDLDIYAHVIEVTESLIKIEIRNKNGNLRDGKFSVLAIAERN